MSRHMHNLLTQAAELRAVGHPWEAVAKHLHRQPATCQKWTSRYRREWERLYRHAQLRRFDETSNEAHSVLKGLLRDKDFKARAKAVEIWLKCGIGTFGRSGAMVHQGPDMEMGEDLGLSQWAARQKGIDEDRARMSQRRPRVAKVVLPAAVGLLLMAAVLTGRSLAPSGPDVPRLAAGRPASDRPAGQLVLCDRDAPGGAHDAHDAHPGDRILLSAPGPRVNVNCPPVGRTSQATRTTGAVPMPRPATRPVRAQVAHLNLQPLEERTVPAFNLTIDGDIGNFNVSRVVAGGVTTYRATGPAANVNVVNLMNDLAVGDVVVTSATGGGEEGTIQWFADSAADVPAEYFGDLRALTFRTASDATAGDVTIDAVPLTFSNNVDLTIDTTAPVADGSISLTTDARVVSARSLTLNAGDGSVFWGSGNTDLTTGSGAFHVTAGLFVNSFDGAAILTDTGPILFDAPIDLAGTFLGLTSSQGAVVLNRPVDGPGSLTLTGGGGVSIFTDLGATTLLDSLVLFGGTTNYGANAINAGVIFVGGATEDGQNATLSGTGPLTGELFVEFDGTLSPGGTTVGTMSLAGNLTFNGGTYALDVGDAADRIDVTGDVTLTGGSLAGVNGPLTAAGNVPIVTFTGTLTGTFNNAPLGAGFFIAGEPVRVTNYGPASTGITIARIQPAAGGVFAGADGDGTAYTAKLTGPGLLTAFRDGLGQLNLVIADTTDKSRVSVIGKANGSDDLVAIGDVRVTGSLGGFSAPTGVVGGAMTATGTIKAVTVYRAFGSLTIGGLAADVTAIKATDWFADIDTGGSLGSVRVAGDFDAGVRAAAVGKVAVGLTLGGGAPGWNVGGIAGITAGRVLGLNLTATFLGDLTVKGNPKRHLAGDVLFANVRLLGNDGNPRTMYGLKSLTAAGTVRFSTFDVQEGNVKAVKVGRFLDSNLYLDYTPGATFTTGAFDSGANFTLGSFTTTAATGTDPNNPGNWSFANSQIAADTIKTVRLSGLRTANGGVEFGIAFRTAGGSVQTKTADVTDPDVPLKANLTPNLAPLAGDFFYLNL